MLVWAIPVQNAGRARSFGMLELAAANRTECVTNEADAAAGLFVARRYGGFKSVR